MTPYDYKVLEACEDLDWEELNDKHFLLYPNTPFQQAVTLPSQDVEVITSYIKRYAQEHGLFYYHIMGILYSRLYKLERNNIDEASHLCKLFCQYIEEHQHHVSNQD